MKVNEAYAAYIAAPSEETKEQLASSLVQYCTAFFKKFFCHDQSTYHTLNDSIGDALLSIWTQLDSFDATKSSLSTWVGTIIRNDVLDRMRKYKTRNEVMYSEIEDSVSPYSGITAKLTLRKLLKTLELEDQKLIHLYLEGHTYQEIAETLQCNIKVVDHRLAEIKSRLSKIVRGE